MPSKEELNRCIEWCKKNGAYVNDEIIFKWTERSGITAVASKAIDGQGPLISIPKALLITNDAARKDFGAEDIDFHLDNPNALGQLFIAKLKFLPGLKSFFSPYIDLLPFRLGQPYFWSKEEIDLLKGTDLHPMLKQNLINMASEWTTLVDLLELPVDDKHFYNQVRNSEEIDIISFFTSDSKNQITPNTSWTSFPAYVWASGIFNSRAFPEIILDNKISNINEAFLFPIVDLLNHKSESRVKWTFNDGKVNFQSLENIKEGDEIFNSYGDKPNEELLLNYGFVQEDNPCDYTKLSLRLDKDILENAPLFGVNLRENRVSDNCVQFKLSSEIPLPDALTKFFGYLSKLKSESHLTLRSVLEGEDQLISILDQKVEFYKKSGRIDQSKVKITNSTSLQYIKQYFNSEKRIYNKSLESLQRKQKEILKKNGSSMVSFKTIFKSDKDFANSLLVAFGIAKFEDLITKNCIKEALLLWIVRVSNKNSYPRKLTYEPPEFIYHCFQEVSKSIVIERDNVTEFMAFYKNLFPNLSSRIPETFGVGNWKIRQFIVADTVLDRLLWTRKLTLEPYFIVPGKY